MASCNSWQYLVTILAKIFTRSWQDLAKILLRYPWRVDPGGKPGLFHHASPPSKSKINKNSLKKQHLKSRFYENFSNPAVSISFHLQVSPLCIRGLFLIVFTRPFSYDVFKLSENRATDLSVCY